MTTRPFQLVVHTAWRGGSEIAVETCNILHPEEEMYEYVFVLSLSVSLPLIISSSRQPATVPTVIAIQLSSPHHRRCSSCPHGGAMLDALSGTSLHSGPRLSVRCTAVPCAMRRVCVRAILDAVEADECECCTPHGRCRTALDCPRPCCHARDGATERATSLDVSRCTDCCSGKICSIAG